MGEFSGPGGERQDPVGKYVDRKTGMRTVQGVAAYLETEDVAPLQDAPWPTVAPGCEPLAGDVGYPGGFRAMTSFLLGGVPENYPQPQPIEEEQAS